MILKKTEIVCPTAPNEKEQKCAMALKDSYTIGNSTEKKTS